MNAIARHRKAPNKIIKTRNAIFKSGESADIFINFLHSKLATKIVVYSIFNRSTGVKLWVAEYRADKDLQSDL